MEDSVLKTCSKEFILNHFDEVDLKKLLRFRKDLDNDVIEKIFQSGISREYIWCSQQISEDLIDKYAKDKFDWQFIGLHQKLSSQFINNHRFDLDLNCFDFDKYTVKELLSVDDVVFPYKAFLDRSFSEKVELCANGKVDIRGKVFPIGRSFRPYFDFTLFAPKNINFIQFKPYLLYNGFLRYLHRFILKYENVVELLAEEDFYVSRPMLELLLSTKKLDVTVGEWDALMMLLEFES